MDNIENNKDSVLEKEVANENEQSAKSAKNTDKAENEFEFVTETIKKKPVNKRKVGLRILLSILMGLIMGVIACVVFVVLSPKLQAIIYPDKPKQITLPEDEEEQAVLPEETNTDEVVLDENEETLEKTAEGDDISDTNEDGTEVAEGEELGSEAETSEEDKVEKPTTIINNIVEQKNFTIDDYKKIYREMSEIANEASAAVVTVNGVSDGTDWFKNKYEAGNESAGLILADNGKELLIITNNIVLSNAKEIEVTFCNDEVYKGVVKKFDRETGLVVVAVNLEDLSDSVNKSISMAKLGNSTLTTLPGTPVIAIGAPLGIVDSMATGLVTSNNRIMDITDSNLRYITTDIYGSTVGSGIIIDLEGRVLGIIFQGGVANDTKNLIHAYSISDIKNKLEKMSNGQELAYLGIKGTDVPEKISEELSVPMGAYVTQVIVDSPAMKAGIQNGDVIVKIGTTDVSSFMDYKDVMLKCQPGDLMMVTVKRLGKDEYLELSFEISLEAQP